MGPVHALDKRREAAHPARVTDLSIHESHDPHRREGHWGSGTGYLVSFALVALVTLIGGVLFARGNSTDIGLLYLIPVMYAGTRHGLATGVVAGLVSSLAYNFFFIPPTHTLSVDNPEHLITLLILLGVAVVGSQLAAQVREQAMLAEARADRNAALAGFARLLTGVSRRDDLWQVAAEEVARLFDVRTIVLVRSPVEAGGRGLVLCASSPPQHRIELIEMAAAQWCFDNAAPAGPGAETLTASEWLFHPVTGPAGPVAVMGVGRADAGEPLHPGQALLLRSLLDQCGLALSRIVAEEEARALGEVRERDRLRAALLSSVSHDLRTPLTTVLATLRAMRAAAPEQEVQLAAARTEAERLNRFVANLLDMVRIETGALDRMVQLVDLSEAAGSAIEDLRPVLGTRRIAIAMPDDLPFALLDPQLFHHCLINLIDNAAKHGGPDGAITVTAGKVADGGLVLSVQDSGPGLPPGEEQRVFATFARLEGSDRTGGSGLGLAIVKGFAEAMGLAARAGNRADGQGACFALHIPPHLVRAPEEMA